MSLLYVSEPLLGVMHTLSWLFLLHIQKNKLAVPWTHLKWLPLIQVSYSSSFLYPQSFDSWKSCSLSGCSSDLLGDSVSPFKQRFPSTKPACCRITWFSWRLLWLPCVSLCVSVSNTQAPFFVCFFLCNIFYSDSQSHMVFIKHCALVWQMSVIMSVKCNCWHTDTHQWISRSNSHNTLS